MIRTVESFFNSRAERKKFWKESGENLFQEVVSGRRRLAEGEKSIILLKIMFSSGRVARTKLVCACSRRPAKGRFRLDETKEPAVPSDCAAHGDDRRAVVTLWPLGGARPALLRGDGACSTKGNVIVPVRNE